ncbi:MAG TPA: MFS transporter [Stellaceae bacterium]|nr:MFS transporter [Stellaceae bacterium]
MAVSEQTQDSEIGATVPRAAGRALDWLNLFVANIQTGFGPFIAVYLTTHGWTQTAIGFALSIGTVTSMASQVPAGALVDAVSRKSRVAAYSIFAFMVSALMFALSPTPIYVYLAEILHGISSCTLGPAIAAMSLALVGRRALGPRLGRNARYAAIGSGVGAALMGACGAYVSSQAIFFLTAALAAPAVLTLIPLGRIDERGAAGGGAPAMEPKRILHLLRDRRLLIFAACALLFTLANTGVLPLVAIALTKRAGDRASLLIAACIVLPQVIMALIAPHVGRIAEEKGRRGVMLLGFAMVPLRCLLFAGVTNPALTVLVQALDGVAAASFGVMVPLVTSDVAGRSGHFTLMLGAVGFAIGIGGTLGTPLAGWLADRLGDPAAFAILAAIGLAATSLVWGAMPETRLHVVAPRRSAPKRN